MLCSPVWAAPRLLTLPLWSGFLDSCQDRERSLRLICDSTTTFEARHLEVCTFPTSRTVSLAQRDVCVCVCVVVCLEIKRINNDQSDSEVTWVTSDKKRVTSSSRFDLRVLGLLRTGHQELDMVSAFCQGVLREILV